MPTCKSGGLYLDNRDMERVSARAAENCEHGYPKTMRGGVLGCSSVCKQEREKRMACQLIGLAPRRGSDAVFEAMFKERYGSPRKR